MNYVSIIKYFFLVLSIVISYGYAEISQEIIGDPYSFDDLNLTMEQKKRINNYLLSYKKNKSENSKTRILNEKLLKMVESKNLEERQLQALANEITKEKTVDLINQVQAQNKIWLTLTEEQKQNVITYRQKTKKNMK